MPRINRGTLLSIEYNALVPAARALGISVREIDTARGGAHVSRSRLSARIEELRNQIASFNLPSSIATMDRTFGCEFEFMLPRGSSRENLALAMRNAGVDARTEAWNHNCRNWWKLTTDGSLNDYTRGTELVSPILTGESGFEAIRKVCQVMQSFGCKVTSRCGFHVHVGVQAEPVSFFKNILKAYRRFEPVIDTLVAPSRRHNQWCNSLRFSDNRLEAARTRAELLAQFPNKYVKLNMATVDRQNTVEFRQHQGTIEARKAEMWIRLCLRMVASASAKTAEQLAASELSLAGFLSMVEAEAGERSYFEERHRFFTPRPAATRTDALYGRPL